MAKGKLARSPIRDFVAAISVGIVDGTPLLDLEYVEDSACDTDMNVVMTASGGFVELQGTAEGATFSRAEMDALLALAGKGIGELVEAQRRALAEPLPVRGVRLVLASNNPGKLAELRRAVRAARRRARRAGRARHRRGRRAARDLHRERARQGAPRGAGRARRGDRRRLGPRRRRARRRAGRRLGALRADRARSGRGPRGASPRQDAANNALLLARPARRARPAARASSRTLVAVRRADDPEPLVAVGRWPGEMLESPRGSGGFGYDPLRLPAALGKTVAELDAATKNRLSHRADAARRMLALMRDAWGLQPLVASSASGR